MSIPYVVRGDLTCTPLDPGVLKGEIRTKVRGDLCVLRTTIQLPVTIVSVLFLFECRRVTIGDSGTSM